MQRFVAAPEQEQQPTREGIAAALQHESRYEPDLRGVAQLMERVLNAAAGDDDRVHKQSRDRHRREVAQPIA